MAGKIDKAVAIIVQRTIAAIKQRHEEATAALDASMLLADRGQTRQALKVLMDYEGPTRDTLDLFKAVLTINRELLKSED